VEPVNTIMRPRGGKAIGLVLEGEAQELVLLYQRDSKDHGLALFAVSKGVCVNARSAEPGTGRKCRGVKAASSGVFLPGGGGAGSKKVERFAKSLAKVRPGGRKMRSPFHWNAAP